MKPQYDGNDLTDPPSYLPQFKKTYQYIINEYIISSRDIAVFIPCAVRKPYSTSPSHKIFHKVFDKVFPNPQKYHVVIFGTCGIVPAELELMYPFAHCHYMLENVKYQKIEDDFLEIETRRIAGYLEKTRNTYKKRIAYCIGLLRKAMIQGFELAGISVGLYPIQLIIDKLYDADCPSPEGSLSMQAYLDGFKDALTRIRDSI